MKQLFAVTGNPVFHSKSPLMFNRIFSVKGMEAVYFRMASGSAAESVSLSRALNLKGFNVTAPFKKEIMQFLDVVDAEAGEIGAVNTVVNENGKLKGYNTDHIGVTGSISEYGIDPGGMKAVVAGAGGAGKAAAYGLVKSGADVTITDISAVMAEKAATVFKCRTAPFSDLRQLVEKSELVVHAVDSVHKAIDPQWINGSQIVYDVNYKDSLFIESAAKKGFRLITGLDMLLGQALPAYRLFLKDDPLGEEMRKGLEDSHPYAISSRIALTGFMGSGKTSAGKELSKLTGYTHVDTDMLIERETGSTIPGIFKNSGEAAFRRAETAVFERVAKMDNVVISCGGGIVLSERNRDMLKNMVTVWLHVSPETCINRSRGGDRPLLETEDPLEKAGSLLRERTGLYAESSDLMVSSEGRDPGEVAKFIAAEFGIL